MDLDRETNTVVENEQRVFDCTGEYRQAYDLFVSLHRALRDDQVGVSFSDTVEAYSRSDFWKHKFVTSSGSVYFVGEGGIVLRANAHDEVDASGVPSILVGYVDSSTASMILDAISYSETAFHQTYFLTKNFSNVISGKTDKMSVLDRPTIGSCPFDVRSVNHAEFAKIKREVSRVGIQIEALMVEAKDYGLHPFEEHVGNEIVEVFSR